jgi:hypothetical protein
MRSGTRWRIRSVRCTGQSRTNVQHIVGRLVDSGAVVRRTGGYEAIGPSRTRIDTLGEVRPRSSGKRNAYEIDVEDLGRLQNLFRACSIRDDGERLADPAVARRLMRPIA